MPCCARRWARMPQPFPAKSVLHHRSGQAAHSSAQAGRRLRGWALSCLEDIRIVRPQLVGIAHCGSPPVRAASCLLFRHCQVARLVRDRPMLSQDNCRLHGCKRIWLFRWSRLRQRAARAESLPWPACNHCWWLSRQDRRLLLRHRGGRPRALRRRAQLAGRLSARHGLRGLHGHTLPLHRLGRRLRRAYLQAVPTRGMLGWRVLLQDIWKSRLRLAAHHLARDIRFQFAVQGLPLVGWAARWYLSAVIFQEHLYGAPFLNVQALLVTVPKPGPMPTAM